MTTKRDLDSQAQRAAEKLAKIRDRQAKRDLRKSDDAYRALDVASKSLRRITADEFVNDMLMAYAFTDDETEQIVAVGAMIESHMALMQNAKAAP